MAITKNTLKTYSYSGNDNVLVCTSTNDAQPNFRLSVVIGKWSTTAASFISIHTQLIPVNPDGDILFNLKDILSTALNYDRATATTASIFFANNSFGYFRISVQEYYGSTPALQGSATTQDIFISKGTINKLTFIGYDFNDWLAASLNVGKWLEMSSEQRYISTYDAYISIFTNSVALGVLEIITYDKGDNVIQTATITNTITTNNNDDRLLQFNLNSTLINAATLVTGSQPVISSDVAYFEVSWYIGGALRSNVYTFEVDNCFINHDVYTLYWFNQFGALQSFACNGKPYTELATTEEMAAFEGGEVVAGDWSISTVKGGDEKIWTENKEKFRLNTGLIDVDEYNRIKEMIKSPVALVRTPDGIFNCKIENSSLRSEENFPAPDNYEINVTISDAVIMQ